MGDSDMSQFKVATRDGRHVWQESVRFVESPKTELKPQYEYRIARQQLRCWYTIIGIAVLEMTFYRIARFVQNRGTVDIAVGCLLIAASFRNGGSVAAESAS